MGTILLLLVLEGIVIDYPIAILVEEMTCAIYFCFENIELILCDVT